MSFLVYNDYQIMEKFGEMELHKPSLFKTALNKLGLWQIRPEDIGNASKIMEKYPDLGGDNNQGPGNDGNCPSWVGDGDWYIRFLRDQGVN